jgi:hypothetical protein
MSSVPEMISVACEVHSLALSEAVSETMRPTEVATTAEVAAPSAEMAAPSATSATSTTC